jgi:CheY-like chemotaxis protein
MTKFVAPKNVILYADDDQDDLMLVKDAFNKYSSYIEVVTVENGNEALSYLSNLSPLDPVPCLIILDINMPRLNGKEVLKEIRLMERFRQTPVVLFSTSSHYYERQFAEDYNAAFITKPMDMGQLEEVTDKFIEQCSTGVRKDLRKN